MKKFLLAGALAVFTLFLPSKSHANPLDVPYGILFTTTSAGSIVVSTTNFPSASVSVNSNVATAQWCINHLIVSAPDVASTVTIAWSTSTLTAATTDYLVVTSTGVPYNDQWSYRQPYCAPVGNSIVAVTSTKSTAKITLEGYLFRGWNQ